MAQKEENADGYDVVVLGSCLMDFICYSKVFPKPGVTTVGTKFEIGFGGKGANQCVAAAKLGSKTALIAKLGADSYGDSYREHLRTENVNTDQVTTVPGQKTGIALINVIDSGLNNIVVVLGANDTLTLEDVDNAKELISSAKVMVCQMETPLRSTIAALKQFKGVSILNAAPAPTEKLLSIYTAPDILCVNEEEAGTMTGRDVPSLTEAKRAMDNFMNLGVRCAIITMGPNGAVFATHSEQTPIHMLVPKLDGPVIDSTGAGDAFIGALAHYTAKDKTVPLKQRIGAAVHIASLSVRRTGTQTSYATLQDIIDFGDIRHKKFDSVTL